MTQILFPAWKSCTFDIVQMKKKTGRELAQTFPSWCLWRRINLNQGGNHSDAPLLLTRIVNTKSAGVQFIPEYINKIKDNTYKSPIQQIKQILKPPAPSSTTGAPGRLIRLNSKKSQPTVQSCLISCNYKLLQNWHLSPEIPIIDGTEIYSTQLPEVENIVVPNPIQV